MKLTNAASAGNSNNLDPGALHKKLTAEYIFSLLTGAGVESIASENAARLAVMG